MSEEVSELRQRKMVPHASLPQKTVSPSTFELGTQFVPRARQEKTGLTNESFQGMGSLDSLESSEGTQSSIPYSECDASNQGRAPKKKPPVPNGDSHSAGDSAIELGTLDNGGYEEETSLTEPLLSDDDIRSKKNNNIQKKKEKDQTTDVAITSSEASWQIGLQVFFPYIVAGLGMVAAGIVLDIVQVCTTVISEIHSSTIK